MPQKARSRRRRVVVDTSVLVAGISGFREPFLPGRNPSADVLHRWAEKSHFVGLITEDILDEYKEVLMRFWFYVLCAKHFLTAKGRSMASSPSV